MFKISYSIALIACLAAISCPGQTTNGVVSGVITDPSGAVVAGAQVSLTDQGTGLVRTSTSEGSGHYTVPQVPPAIYKISVAKQGFATDIQSNVQLQVNGSITLDFKLMVSSTTQVIEVTSAPPQLNTTSATLGDVVGHQAVVELPLNGRNFTQLTLLTPGAAPVGGGQQNSKTVKLGAGAISPAVNGQRPQQNNFTMDGVLNNSIYTNIWAISPPPDALQEFNVQSHITDAQFSITSGANINIATRSGTKDFHGSLWEFLRNDALDAQTFPQTARLPYKQNQYGVFLGGPVLVPRIHTRENTWFSAYWEGFRSQQSNSYFASTFTPAMLAGDFSALLGPQVGTDSLGRPEYKNELYDPTTSRPDPSNPALVLRDPFLGNVIPKSRINPASALILQKYYPAPNLNVAAGVLPNLAFTGVNSTASDQAGIRIDHSFGNSDTVFGRYNRFNANLTQPESLPGFAHTVANYAQTAAAGYTHLFGTATVLSLHYGYTNTNVGNFDQAAGAAFNDAIHFSQANPAKNGLSYAPQVNLSNGYSGVNQAATPNGPQENSDFHADLSKVRGNHTIGVGGMFYHIHSFDDGWNYTVRFTQNATSQSALTGSTGLGPASLLLGLPDSYSGSLGDTAADQTMNWYGGYLQDQWQASAKLALTLGLRYDYITPADFHKTVSGLDALTGQFTITGPVLPLYPKATGPKGYFQPQYTGFEPRFGIAYKASEHTVFRSALAVLDDHNNTLVQENQDLRLSWPTGISTSVTNQNRGLPSAYIDQLPAASTYFNTLKPYASFGANPHNKIPYSIEYNAGVQQQISSTLALNLDYVGSVGRHQFIQPAANTARIPGPGSLASRGQPFPQYGGPFSFDMNAGNSSYNAFQAQLKKSLSSGLFFMASYTWSKSLDIESAAQNGSIQDFYNLGRDKGPSDFDRKHIFVFSGVYTLPVGRGTRFLSDSNALVQALAGDWHIGYIVSLVSGAPFNAGAGGDIANVGAGSQRAQKIADPYSGSGFKQSPQTWINKASFSTPAQYTFGNEGRNDLLGPLFKNVDSSVFKNIVVREPLSIQFRAEAFNILNHTNYGTPGNNVQSSSFGKITGANGTGREIQFGLKVLF